MSDQSEVGFWDEWKDPKRVTYWKKYEKETPPGGPQEIRKLINEEIFRLEGELYRNKNNGQIMQQLQDAKKEYDLANRLAGWEYAGTFKHPVAKKKPERIGGLSLPLIETIQKRRGVESE